MSNVDLLDSIHDSWLTRVSNLLARGEGVREIVDDMIEVSLIDSDFLTINNQLADIQQQEMVISPESK